MSRAGLRRIWVSPYTVAIQVLLAGLCIIFALKFDPKDGLAWYNFVTMGGGTVQGLQNSAKASNCVMEALELDPSDALAWYNLGNRCGGGTVGGLSYSEKDCYMKALELDPKLGGTNYAVQ